jgi:type I restriction enzyme, S subunit
LAKQLIKFLKKLDKTSELIELSEMGELIKGKGIPKSEVLESGIPCRKIWRIIYSS